jgi:hypothetical protein
LLVAALLTSTNAACKSRPSPPPQPARPAAAPISSTKVVVKAQGKSIAELIHQGGDWLLSGEGVSLTCRAHNAGKHFCQAGSGAIAAEVKLHDEPDGGGAIKLLGADGKLRWKVRYDAEKIKVSDNEENRNPWTVSLKHGDKLKVTSPAGQEVGVVRRAEGLVEGPAGEKLFHVDGGGAADALLLMSALEATDRLILMAELVARGL